jgi:putative ABC transport system permease protein
MNVFMQIKAVTAMSLATLTQRAGTSLVIVAGTAGVVAVLVSILALAAGLEQTIAAAGRAERAVVIYRGAEGEAGSSIPRSQVLTTLDLPGIQRDTNGKLLASADAIGSLWLTRGDGSTPASVPIRGITPGSLALRPEFQLTDGRMFEPGLKQVIVGRAAQGRYAGLEVGDRILSLDSEWEVVGVFTTGGSAHESELWSDAESVLAAFHRNSFSSVTAWVGNAAELERMTAAAASDPTLNVDIYRESDFYADQSNDFSGFLSVIANVIGTIMAIGAVFGALNSMYTAVSARTGEIATLRAIGFGATGIVISVFVEALLLAITGALAGAALAWLFFNGNTVSTVSGDNGMAQVVFSLRIGLDAVLLGISWSLVLGLIGGLFPAIRAARLPVVVALRGA